MRAFDFAPRVDMSHCDCHGSETPCMYWSNLLEPGSIVLIMAILPLQARTMKPGQSFRGVVLSSEAVTVVSRADRDLIATNGVAGINCSWNRQGLAYR